MNGNAIYTYDRLLLDFFCNTAIAIRAGDFPNSQNMDSRANCHKRIAIDEMVDNTPTLVQYALP